MYLSLHVESVDVDSFHEVKCDLIKLLDRSAIKEKKEEDELHVDWSR